MTMENKKSLVNNVRHELPHFGEQVNQGFNPINQGLRHGHQHGLKDVYGSMRKSGKDSSSLSKERQVEHTDKEVEHREVSSPEILRQSSGPSREHQFSSTSNLNAKLIEGVVGESKTNKMNSRPMSLRGSNRRGLGLTLPSGLPLIPNDFDYNGGGDLDYGYDYGEDGSLEAYDYEADKEDDDEQWGWEKYDNEDDQVDNNYYDPFGNYYNPVDEGDYEGIFNGSYEGLQDEPQTLVDYLTGVSGTKDEPQFEQGQQAYVGTSSVVNSNNYPTDNGLAIAQQHIESDDSLADETSPKVNLSKIKITGGKMKFSKPDPTIGVAESYPGDSSEVSEQQMQEPASPVSSLLLTSPIGSEALDLTSSEQEGGENELETSAEYAEGDEIDEGSIGDNLNVEDAVYGDESKSYGEEETIQTELDPNLDEQFESIPAPSGVTPVLYEEEEIEVEEEESEEDEEEEEEENEVEEEEESNEEESEIEEEVGEKIEEEEEESEREEEGIVEDAVEAISENENVEELEDSTAHEGELEQTEPLDANAGEEAEAISSPVDETEGELQGEEDGIESQDAEIGTDEEEDAENEEGEGDGDEGDGGALSQNMKEEEEQLDEDHAPEDDASAIDAEADEEGEASDELENAVEGGADEIGGELEDESSEEILNDGDENVDSEHSEENGLEEEESLGQDEGEDSTSLISESNESLDEERQEDISLEAEEEKQNLPEPAEEEEEQQVDENEDPAAEINEETVEKSWKGFSEDKVELDPTEGGLPAQSKEVHDVSELHIVEEYQGDGFDNTTPPSQSLDDSTSSQASFVSTSIQYAQSNPIAASAALFFSFILLIVILRRRRQRSLLESKKRDHQRGKYSALSGDDFFNSNFTDDVSFHGKDSDDEVSVGSFGSDDGNMGNGSDGIKIELGTINGNGSIHENGGDLTLEEING